jgi:hypothetical protein
MRSTAFYASHLEPLLPPTCNLAKNRGLFPKHLQAVKRVRNTVMGNIQVNNMPLNSLNNCPKLTSSDQRRGTVYYRSLGTGKTSGTMQVCPQ